MKIKALKGKSIKGFKFKPKYGLHYSEKMDEFVGVTGKVVEICYKSERVGEDFDGVIIQFNPGYNGTWTYPYPECLEHLATDEEFAAFEESKLKEKRLELVEQLRQLSQDKHIKQMEVDIPTETIIQPGTHSASNLLSFIADMVEE